MPTLAGSNTYGGATTISNGTVNIAHPLAVQNSTVDAGSSSGALSFAAGIVHADAWRSGRARATLRPDDDGLEARHAECGPERPEHDLHAAA